MSNVQYVPSPERFRFSIAHCSLLIAHFGRPVQGSNARKVFYENSLPAPLEPERGCVVLDQPQHAASSRRLRTSHALRLVFDTAALRSNGAGGGVMFLPDVAKIPAPGQDVCTQSAFDVT